MEIRGRFDKAWLKSIDVMPCDGEGKGVTNRRAANGPTNAPSLFVSGMLLPKVADVARAMAWCAVACVGVCFEGGIGGRRGVIFEVGGGWSK